MRRANKTIYKHKVRIRLPMSEQVRPRQVSLNEGRTLVNTKGVYGSKFGNETHVLSFAAIVATRNGTKGSNFHVRNAMTTRIEMSGNRGWLASFAETGMHDDGHRTLSLIVFQCNYNIKHNFSCTSIDLIYYISCSKCGMLYIWRNWKTIKDKAR